MFALGDQSSILTGENNLVLNLIVFFIFDDLD